MRRLRRAACLLIAVAACARMAQPPGGPVRHMPPVLLSSFPDSGVAPCDFHADATYQYDEVTSDAGEPNFGYGNGALEKLILFSPDTLVPRVEWHRDRITVRPRDGWRPHTTYRIEVLPGLFDLRQNKTKSSNVIAFTTCGPAPTRVLSGRAIDWAAVRAIPFALIEAFHLPDSARYRAVADSTGRFHFGALPDGAYLVVATNDQNHDNKRNPSEAWDSVRVDATRDTVGEIWTFARDTLPPKIQDIARIDSVTLSVTFTRPIDPELRLDSASIRVGALLPPDTISITPLEAMPKAYYDSTHKPVPPPKAASDSGTRPDSGVRADSSSHPDSAILSRKRLLAGVRSVDSALKNADSTVRSVADSVSGRLGVPQGPPPDLPKQHRPVLGNVIIIRTVGQLRPGSSYYVELRHVRLEGGRTGPPVGRRLDVPKPQPQPVVKSKADSLAPKTHADSLRADSLRLKARPDSLPPKTHADSLRADSLRLKTRPDSLRKAKPDSTGTIRRW